MKVTSQLIVPRVVCNCKRLLQKDIVIDLPEIQVSPKMSRKIVVDFIRSKIDRNKDYNKFQLDKNTLLCIFGVFKLTERCF